MRALFTLDDHGDRTFQVSFLRAGPRTLEVRSDSPGGPVGGTILMVGTGPPDHLQLALDDQQKTLVVTVVDQHENCAKNHNGRVRVEAENESLSLEHTFDSSDRGRHAFSLTGVQLPTIIRVTDVADASLSAHVSLEGVP